MHPDLSIRSRVIQGPEPRSFVQCLVPSLVPRQWRAEPDHLPEHASADQKVDRANTRERRLSCWLPGRSEDDGHMEAR